MNGFIRLGIHILEVIFAIGAVGSALVLVLAAILEARTAFGSEDEDSH